jgi:hypothetical protein
MQFILDGTIVVVLWESNQMFRSLYVEIGRVKCIGGCGAVQKQ